MIVALTGSTGNMGRCALEELLKNKKIEKIKLLVLPDDKRIKSLIKKHKKERSRIEIIFGNIAQEDICNQLVKDCQYVINLCAVIPPHSDKSPLKAIECNQIGVDNLVTAIENITENQPKFIHTSTVALYGNRNSKHIWGRVGDPLLVSPYDIYSATKLRGEFRVLESNIENWAVLRQTAMLHSRMLADNMSDGLMFHTCFNAPLEWVTAHDSGVLIANIIKEDEKQNLKNKFWNKCFNIGGGIENCVTGYDTLNDGFKIIGGSAKDFFDPNFNALRNFHGVWFEDGNKLNELFNYQSQTISQFWKQLEKDNPILKAGKIVPKSLIKKFAIKRLLKDENSPFLWVKSNDEGKITAYFKSKENWLNIPKKWKDFPLLIENKDEEGNNIDYNNLKNTENIKLIDYFYDINKNDEDITIKDLKNVAKAHGGELISKKFEQGNLRQKLEWKTQDGEIFSANVYTVLKAGHWFNPIYKSNIWDFDRLSKNDKIFAQIWHDSHDTNENNCYSFDENFNSIITKK